MRRLMAGGVVWMLVAVAAAGSPVQGGQGQPAPGGQVPGQALRQGAPVVAVDQAASATREQLEELLQRFPPALGSVLKLDPGLLGNPAYIAAYPALGEFLAKHPEVLRDPQYFLARIRVRNSAAASDDIVYSPYSTPKGQSLAMVRDMLQFLTGTLIGLLIIGTLAWLVKALVDYRRWFRLSKIQAEVHNKVLDRLASSEELMAYMQTPAGRRFLESTPIILDAGAGEASAPVRRALWAIQAGIVLAAIAAGLIYVSGQVEPEATQAVLSMGVLALSAGIGFVVAALVAMLLSRRLGLLLGTSASRQQ